MDLFYLERSASISNDSPGSRLLFETRISCPALPFIHRHQGAAGRVYSNSQDCFPFSIGTVSFPARPASWPVPESGTTATFCSGAPRVSVPQDEAAGAAIQSARDAFDRDIARRALHFRAGREHLALGRRSQTAMVLLVDRDPRQRRALGFVRRSLRDQLDFKRSTCTLCRHHYPLLSGISQRRLYGRVRGTSQSPDQAK